MVQQVLRRIEAVALLQLDGADAITAGGGRDYTTHSDFGGAEPVGVARLIRDHFVKEFVYTLDARATIAITNKVPLRADDSLAGEWGLIACGPARRVAFLARSEPDTQSRCSTLAKIARSTGNWN